MANGVVDTFWALATRADVLRYAISQPPRGLLVSDKTPDMIPNIVEVGPSRPERSITLSQGPEQIDAAYPENEILAVSISTIFIDCIKAISSIVKESTITFSPRGIDLVHIQSPPGTYILLHIRAGDLEKFRVKDGQSISITVNILNLLNSLKNKKGGEMKIISDHPGKLYFQKDGGWKELIIPDTHASEVNTSAIPEPDKFHTELCAPSADMKTLFPRSTRHNTDDDLRFILVEDGITIHSTEDTGESKKHFSSSRRTPTADNYYFTKFNGGQPFAATLNLDGIPNVFRLMGNRKTVFMSISNHGMIELRTMYGQLSYIKVYIPYIETEQTNILDKMPVVPDEMWQGEEEDIDEAL